MNLIQNLYGELRRKLLFAFIIITLVAANAAAQAAQIDQDGFSRFSVTARASHFEDEMLQAARSEGVDPNILWTIAYLETRFRPWLTSPKNARGLMQFIPATAARYGLSNPYDPAAAIRSAARYVKFLTGLFGGRIDSVLAAYNSGEGTVAAYSAGKTIVSERKTINPNGLRTVGGVPPYAETVAYVGRGLRIYRWLLARGTFPANLNRAHFPSSVSPPVAKAGRFGSESRAIVSSRKTALPGDGNKAYVSVETTAQSERKAQSRFTQVYYEARTGTRYGVQNGTKTKLPESGLVVINETARPETTNKARSRLFAASNR